MSGPSSILQYGDEINTEPVSFRWTWHLSDKKSKFVLPAVSVIVLAAFRETGYNRY